MALKAGSIRFNTDLSQMEIWDGHQWTGILGTSPEQQTGGTRMLFMGGTNGSSVLDVIEFVNLATTGNAVDFGNLIASEMEGSSCSSRTRGFYFGGDPADNDIEFVTFASQGNATDFGNLNATSKSGSGCSNQTRGIQQLGYPGPQNNISFITMATTGDALDFGDMTGNSGLGGACDSPTRGLIARGFDSNNYLNTLEYITIATTGNAADFGDLLASGVHCVMYSNAVRGVRHAGHQYPASPNHMNIIEFVTIATLGNATDFGDALTGGYGCGGSSPTRGVAGGGYFAGAPTGEASGFTNIIDFVEIMTTGNAFDFGDLSAAKRHVKGDSNGHGGL